MTRNDTPVNVEGADIVMQHLFQSSETRIGVAVYQVYALREPEINVFYQPREYSLLAAEMAIYRALADTH